MKSFSERLKQLRQQFGWTQDDLANKMGVSRSTIAGYEAKSKLREPDFETVQKLANLFDVSVDYLLGRTDSRETPQHDKINTSADEVTELLETLHKRPEMKMLFSITKNATKEDIEKAVKIIEALKDN